MLLDLPHLLVATCTWVEIIVIVLTRCVSLHQIRRRSLPTMCQTIHFRTPIRNINYSYRYYSAARNAINYNLVIMTSHISSYSSSSLLISTAISPSLPLSLCPSKMIPFPSFKGGIGCSTSLGMDLWPRELLLSVSLFPAPTDKTKAT